MNRFFSKGVFSAYAFVLIALFACTNDEDFPSTGKPGLPSSFEYSDGSRFSFAYANGQLSRILAPDGGGTDFHYKNGELSSLSFFPPEGMADGHGWVEFEKIDERTIQVRHTGEPMLSAFQMEEITLDEHGYPVRITDLGAYDSQGTNEDSSSLELLWEGKTFTLLTFDLSSGNVLKQEMYSRSDSMLLLTNRYEYTSTPGMLSGVKLPRWFTGYWSSRQVTQSDPYYRLFFNTHHNLSKELGCDIRTCESLNATYEYRYDENGFPCWVSNEALPEGVQIRY